MRLQLRDETVENRQRKGSGFACARLRDAEDIALGECWRNRLRLNRRRHFVAVSDERIEQRLREFQLNEGGVNGERRGWRRMNMMLNRVCGGLRRMRRATRRLR